MDSVVYNKWIEPSLDSESIAYTLERIQKVKYTTETNSLESKLYDMGMETYSSSEVFNISNENEMYVEDEFCYTVCKD